MRKPSIIILLFLLTTIPIFAKSAMEYNDLIALSIQKEENGEAQIYTYSLVNEELKQLTEEGGYSPVWSPDKKEIAFVRNMTEDEFLPMIFKISYKGTEEMQLTSDGISDCPSWSKEKDIIAYNTYNTENGTGIFNMDDNGLKQCEIVINDDHTNQEIVEKGLGGYAKISPDGEKILFIIDNRIAVINVDGSGFTYITGKNQWASYPRWCSGKEEVIYIDKYKEIYITDMSGNNSLVYESKSKDLSNVVCSPDGNKIIFIKSGDIYITNKDGTDLKEVNLPLKNYHDIFGIDW